MLLYGLCWAPIKLYQFMLDYDIIGYCTRTQMYIIIGCYFVCHWTAMSNSFVNPIVYSFMSSSFRVCISSRSVGLITKCFNSFFCFLFILPLSAYKEWSTQNFVLTSRWMPPLDAPLFRIDQNTVDRGLIWTVLIKNNMNSHFILFLIQFSIPLQSFSIHNYFCSDKNEWEICK